MYAAGGGVQERGLRYTTIAVPLSALAAFYEKQGRPAEADRTYSQAVTAYARQGEILGDGGYISATNVVDCLYRYAGLGGGWASDVSML
jgi:hypothetical protein